MRAEDGGGGLSEPGEPLGEDILDEHVLVVEEQHGVGLGGGWRSGREGKDLVRWKSVVNGGGDDGPGSCRRRRR